MKYNIRQAYLNDIPAIKQMADIVFRHTYRDIITPEQMEFMMEWMYSDNSLQKQMESGHIYLILSTSDKIDVGYVSINKEAESETQILYHLQKIYVLPEMQGKGLGAFLLQQAEKMMMDLAHDSKNIRYELNVNRSNPAVAFYEHMGLNKDREGDFPIGNGFFMNDYIMAKDLK